MRLRLVFMAILYLISAPAWAEPLSEPLPVMQMNPAMLRTLDPAADTAYINRQPSLTLNQYYATIFLADRLPTPTRYLADMELYIAEFRLDYPISESLEVRLNLPLIYSYRGVFDSAIREFHQAFGMPDNGRHHRPYNSYAYYFSEASGSWNASPRWELGNIDMQLKYQIVDHDELDNRNISLALLAALKLPTASRSRGWGSGSSDIGIGAVASKVYGDLFSHLNIWWLRPLSKNGLGNPVRDYFRSSLTLGGEWSWLSSKLGSPITLLTQLQGGSSPYQTGIAALDESPWLISFGANIEATENRIWNFTFTENITQSSTQDFNITLGFTLLFDTPELP